MSRRDSYSNQYNFRSPGGYGSSGDEGFRSPRPQYQSSPRHYPNQQQHGHRFQKYPSNYQYHPNMSPINNTSPAQDQNNFRQYNRNTPSPSLSPNKRGRGRGRGGYHSKQTGYSPRYNNDSNPGGSDNISEYFHPSMLEDPWEKLEAANTNSQSPKPS